MHFEQRIDSAPEGRSQGGEKGAQKGVEMDAGMV